jgi:thiol:disulfide interchange protein DsbD
MENLVNNFSQVLDSANFMVVLGVAFLGGVLASFTPCVYPVIPITVGFIGGGSGGSKTRGFILSISYVLGLAFVYSAMGLLASLTGQLFGQISASPWVNFLIANICIVFALAMLDVIHIPALALHYHPKKKGGIVTAFLVGAASALIASPCSTPILGTILLYVATKQEVVFGAALLFSYALGMSVLLVVIGTFSSALHSLPKAGPWMQKIQKGFGVLLLLVGEYFLFQMGLFWN